MRPELRICLIESGPRLGGDHTWSFHETDIPLPLRPLIAPLISHGWPAQEVRFPAYRRRLGTPYRSILSSDFDRVVRADLGERVLLETPAASLRPEGVILGDGRRIPAGAVIDARGQGDYRHLALRFQKFVGLEVEFAGPHGLDAPIIMDADLPQLDGYRFVYVLPFTDRTALIEDTYYADGAALDQTAIEERIEDYAARQGWRIARVIRREAGVLPIALGGDLDAHLAQFPDGIAPVGLAAGLFHPLTGYSLPDAVRLADEVCAQYDFSREALSAFTRSHARRQWQTRGFYRLLSRLLFDAAVPEKRFEVMERFYRFRQPLIERFYAGTSTLGDKARILAGKPPVPLGAAMKCLGEPQVAARQGEG